MFKKGSKLYSILRAKCPRCHEGDMFDYHPYQLSKIGQMKTSCSHCNLVYSREPGFFFGAAYVSYAITVAIGVAGFLAIRILAGEVSWQTYLIGVSSLIVLLFPITFIYSRTVWINLFVNYEPTHSTKTPSHED